jgi:fluoride exporter
MFKVLLLILGGAMGTLTRYSISGLAHRYLGSDFPYGTLSVNLLGSFAIGLLWGLFENESLSSAFRSFAFIGFLGGFTTFSSYSLETLNLFRDGQVKIALMNILLNNIFGLVLVFGGFVLARLLRH